MTPDELEEIPAAIERLFYDQQVRVMEDVVRRIHKTGRITSTADYQIGKMAQQGKSTEWIESEIKRLGNLTDAEVRSLYDKVIQADYVRKRGLYEQVNANYTPYEDNKVMQKWVHALIDQTQGELKNISRSMGFSVPTGNGKTTFTPLADYYQRYIDRACMDIMTGAFDYNTVLRRVAKEMADSGLEYVSYASGHVDRATVAARRAVMTGVNQLSGQINMRLADELGTNHFEVSWHSGARPEHWWGGQVFSKEDLVDVCGYGEVTGLLGANCRHSFMPFVPGVSTRTYTDEQLAEMNAKERETKTYNGKEYNAYSATQRQRELERRMQKQRANIVSLKKGEGSKEDIAAAQAKYLKTLYQYRDFSKQMGLSPQMERVYVDRLGRAVNNGRPKSAFGEERGITNKRVHKNDDYRVDKKEIQSNDYVKKFNGIGVNKNVDESICKCARAGLTHRDGTTREDLYIISARTGKVLGKNVNDTIEFGVSSNESIVNAVKNCQGDLIGLHTHPDGTPPTGSDFEVSGRRRYNIGVVACADGSVYTYKHSEQYISQRYIDDTIEKYKKMVDESGKKMYNSDIEAHKAALEQLSKEYGIHYEERRKG